MRVVLACLPILSLAVVPAGAQDYDVPNISAYYCDQLGGEVSGNRTCLAPYRAYPGDACSVFDETRDQDPDAAALADSVTQSCEESAVDEAKAVTLEERADLRGYVSLGFDESVNDPVANPDYRPGEATFYPGNRYFAAECAVQTCGSGGAEGRTATAPAPSDDSAGAGAQECPYQRDGTCDEPSLCPRGTDREDCAGTFCAYENDGSCDAPGLCAIGTDRADCGGTGTAPSEGTMVEFCFVSPRYPEVWIAYGVRLKGAESRFKFSGWRKVANNACSSIGRVVGGVVHVYANTERIDGTRLVWSGDHEACVSTKRFDYFQDYPGEPCRERSERFLKKSVRGDKDRINFRDDGG